jgi:hypothetical protein
MPEPRVVFVAFLETSLPNQYPPPAVDFFKGERIAYLKSAPTRPLRAVAEMRRELPGNPRVQFIAGSAQLCMTGHSVA